jgi:preprotein translocase subunit SecY
MIIAFTYFYTAITINPSQIAEDLKKTEVLFPAQNRQTDSPAY